MLIRDTVIFWLEPFSPRSDCSVLLLCCGMICVRCGGDGHLEAPDDDGLMTYMSYSNFDAGLVCITCMESFLLRSDSVSSSDSELLSQDQYFEDGPQAEPSCADGITVTLKFSAMEAKLLRANQSSVDQSKSPHARHWWMLLAKVSPLPEAQLGNSTQPMLNSCGMPKMLSTLLFVRSTSYLDLTTRHHTYL